MLFTLLLPLIASALLANAAIYVTEPAAGSTCHGGQPCTVTWVDDGQAPLLSAIGDTKVGLYTGELQLVQTIQPVNVADTHSLTFTPNSKAGPDSGAYYIAFIPVSDSTYRGYSPWFSLDNMSGSFNAPDSSATSTLSQSSEVSSLPGSTLGTAKSPSGSTPTTTIESSTATGGTSSGFTTSRASASGATSSGATTSSSGTTTGSSTSSTPSNAGVSNNMPATGFAWTLLALLGATIL